MFHGNRSESAQVAATVLLNWGMAQTEINEMSDEDIIQTLKDVLHAIKTLGGDY